MTKCRICKHRKRDRINQDIINGVPYRTIAKKYDISTSSIVRHKKSRHISLNLTPVSLSRDAQGRFAPGNPGGGRPKGSVSIVGIIKEKLAQVSPDERRNLAEYLVDEYLEDTLASKDGPAIRDLADRIDGKARQSVDISHSHQDREWLALFQNIGTRPETKRNVIATNGTRELAFKPTENRLEELRFRAWKAGIPADIVERRLSECIDSNGQPDEQAGLENLASYIRNYEHTKAQAGNGGNGDSATHAEISPKVLDTPREGIEDEALSGDITGRDTTHVGTPPDPGSDGNSQVGEMGEMGMVSASKEKRPETAQELKDRRWAEFMKRQAVQLEQEAADEDYNDAY